MRNATLGLLLLVVVLMGTTAFITFKKETARPYFTERLANADFAGLYDLYDEPELPSLGIGEQDAPLTIIIYAQFTSDAGKRFIDDIYPALSEEYIATGRARLYHKHHLTAEEYKGQGDAYEMARVHDCIAAQMPGSYATWYPKLYHSSREQTLKMLVDSEGDAELFETCMQAPDALMDDVSDVEHLGLVGATPQILIGIAGKQNSVIHGVPTYAQLQILIRQQGILIGD